MSHCDIFSRMRFSHGHDVLEAGLARAAHGVAADVCGKNRLSPERYSQ
jgi:hypothetical protein